MGLKELGRKREDAMALEVKMEDVVGMSWICVRKYVGKKCWNDEVLEERKGSRS